MAKTGRQLSVKVREIFALVRVSDTPLSLLSLQCTGLLDDGWGLGEVERVSGAVMELLIRNGWKRRP